MAKGIIVRLPPERLLTQRVPAPQQVCECIGDPQAEVCIPTGFPQQKYRRADIQKNVRGSTGCPSEAHSFSPCAPLPTTRQCGQLCRSCLSNLSAPVATGIWMNMASQLRARALKKKDAAAKGQ